jgi:ribonucleoside-diphosphate reductase alpha chain
MHTQAQLSKFAGGLGVDITPIRAMGSLIESSGGKAAGVIKYAKIFNDTVVAFDQGGRRPGAGCLYLELTHPDVRNFIKIRRNTGDERLLCHDTSIAIWVPNDFYKRVEQGKDWYFICPSEAPDLHELYGEAFDNRYAEYIEMCEAGKIKNWSKMPAKMLEKEFLIQAMETGYPFVGFKDAINLQYPNSHVGVVKSSNLCVEICEHTVPSEYDERGHKTKVGETAVCTISSTNLNAVSRDELEYVIYLQTRAADNAVTLNRYTTDESEKGSLKHRYIGLGTMGWQDVLYKMGIPYDTPEAAEIVDEIQEEVSYYVIKASISLAKERGTYSTFEGSSWSKGLFPQDLHAKYAEYMGVDLKIKKRKNWDSLKTKLLEYGIRNSNCIAIAPNATIADICGCFPSIDPCYSVLHTRETLSGQFVYTNEYFVNDMKKEDLWTEELVNELKKYEGDVLKLNIPEKYKKLYRRVFDLDFFKIIDCASERAKWIDQSQSFNLYNNKRNMKYAHDLYVYCWKKLLKTVYYMRSESASKMEKVTTTQIEDKKEEISCSVNNPDCESCQ